MSRPFSWINTALPFLAMAWSVRHGLTPAVNLGTIYFLAPYNLLLYGANDLYGYDSDRLNPRKGGAIEGGILAPDHARYLWLAIAATNLPFLLLLSRLGGPGTVIVLAATVVVALAYSMPPLRTKVIPGLDSATSSLHFVLPAICGGVVAGASPGELPGRLLLAFFLWGMASQALGAIQDIACDREAGTGSIAVSLGPRRTAFFSVLGCGVAVYLVASQDGAALVAAAVLVPYVLLAASCLTGDPEIRARDAWQAFLGLNLLAGFVITQILLHVWGAGSVALREILALRRLQAAPVPASITWLGIIVHQRPSIQHGPGGPRPARSGQAPRPEPAT